MNFAQLSCVRAFLSADFHGAAMSAAPAATVTPPLRSLPAELESRLLAALARLGHSAFKPGQREAATSLLLGEDVVLLLPTGGGKSAVFTLPALARGGVSVVVSPLVALMADQSKALAAAGVAAAALTSGTDAKQRRALLADLSSASPATSVVFVAPEMLDVNAGLVSVLAALAARRKLFVAVDEAHLVTAWGSSFRSAYKRLGELRSSLPGAPWVALTASASPADVDKISASLRLASPRLVRAPFDRPNVFLQVVHRDLADDASNSARDAALASLVASSLRDAGGAAIVYCRSRAEVDRVAKARVSFRFQNQAKRSLKKTQQPNRCGVTPFPPPRSCCPARPRTTRG